MPQVLPSIHEETGPTANNARKLEEPHRQIFRKDQKYTAAIPSRESVTLRSSDDLFPEETHEDDVTGTSTSESGTADTTTGILQRRHVSPVP